MAIHVFGVDALRRKRPEPLPSLIKFVESGHKEDALVEFLRRSEGKSLLEEEYRTAAPWSSWNRIQYLEATRPTDGFAAVHIAAERGKTRLLEQIVASGARVDQKDHRGQTAFMVAAACGGLASLETLLRLGASLAAADEAGRRALHHAIHSRAWSPKAVEMLVNARAEVEVRDNHGITPVMLATATGCLPTAEVLLQLGVRGHCFDDSARSLLNFARTSYRRSGRPVPSGIIPPPWPLEGGIGEGSGRTSDAGPKKYWRWDEPGVNDMQRLLLADERERRRCAVELIAMRSRGIKS
eukprot:TRINITY_DN44934_c0_g1_i1.p1 TRINITY_DN44934_c0_g1~~TRINITY_DN44934_c0_g1_i1.p1  ORF type:complete len:297 (+),score=43.89 TRINITY_DN44934_c0_g1_i1:227-1117(+)